MDIIEPQKASSATDNASQEAASRLLDDAGTAKQPICHEDISTKQISNVGYYLSTQVEKEGYCDGAAHPYEVHKFSTVDKDTTEQVKLEDIFDSTDIYKALMQDKVVSKALSDAHLHPKDYFELKEDLSKDYIPVSSDINGNEIHSLLNDKILSDFAFHHLEDNNNKVALRLLMDYNGEVANFSEDQLGILLPVPPALKDDLLDASEGKHGFLMKDAQAKGKTVHFSRSYPFPY